MKCWRTTVHSLLLFFLVTVVSSTSAIREETNQNEKDEGHLRNVMIATQTTNTNNNNSSSSSVLAREMVEEDTTDSPQTRIVGGDESEIGKYPYFVEWSVGCGGSLIAPDIVLTAAHCAGSWKGYVHVGAFNADSTANGAVKRTVDQVVIHPKYNQWTLAFDFALLKLESPVWNKKLVQLNFNSNKPWNGQPLRVMGLGATKNWGNYPNTLQEVKVNYMTNNYCNNVKDYDGEVLPNMLCAADLQDGGKDSCSGDSGGPLVIKRSGGKKDLQVGVVSWSYDCADPDLPGVYARVSKIKWWIQSKGCNLSNFYTLCSSSRGRRRVQQQDGGMYNMTRNASSFSQDDDNDENEDNGDDDDDGMIEREEPTQNA